MQHGRRTSGARREKEKKQPNFLMGWVLGLFVIGLVASVAIKAGRGSRRACQYDQANRKSVCKTKQLLQLPKEIPEAALSLHLGAKLDKAENFFTRLSADNFTRFVHLQELRLIKCGIEEIGASAFQPLVSLQHLDLRYNRIQRITEETLKGLGHLEYLYLSNNPIHQIEDFLFRGLTVDNLVLANNPALTDISERAFEGASVETLVLNRCSLGSLRSATLTPLAASLRELYITHSIEPLHLPDDVFAKLNLSVLSLVNNGLDDVDFLDEVTAEEIYLDDNPIQDLQCSDAPGLARTRILTVTKAKISQLSAENLSSLQNLEELDLDGNALTTLNATALQDLDKLSVLDLSNNDIQNFEGNFSGVLDELDVLFLDGNEIQGLPSNIQTLFSRLKNLTMHNNPLHCNCELRWLAKWLEGGEARGILQELPQVWCATPEAVNFTLVSDYGFQCRPPAIFNASMDTDGISLVCTAEGDPAPVVTWLSPDGTTKMRHPDEWDKDVFKTKSSLTVTKEGNYTCIASNILGEEKITIDTRKLPTSGLRLRVESQEIEILETPQGLCIIVAFMALLGYYLRVDSLRDLQRD